MIKILKPYKTYLAPIISWILLIIYLLAPRIHAYIVQNEGRPLSNNIDIPETTIEKNFWFFIDDFSIIDRENNLYRLSGWAFSTATPDEPTNKYKTEIILFSKTKNYVFESQPQGRNDIVDTFSDLQIEIIKPGFSCVINKFAINYGKYCVGLQLTHTEKNIRQFFVTNKVLTYTPFTFELSEDSNSLCEVYIN
jgi:hypothetical protein